MSLPRLILAVGLVLTTSTAFARDARSPSVDPAAPAAAGLALVDWGIVLIYAASTLGLGWYYGRRRQTTQEYFTGTGRMNPILIGVSLFATLLSTISYLSMPGEIQGKGPTTLVALAAYPLIYLIVGYVLLPVYMKQRVTSAYELLEHKLGLSVRLLGASLFVVLRLIWMSLLVYLTAKAMAIMLGVPEKEQDEWIRIIVLVTGFVAVTYTTLGGLQAVVITDAMQTILLYSGALLVIGTITYNMGGVGWFPTEWQANWDTQPFISSNPAERVTVVGTILSVAIWYICTSGGDQTSVQRFMATSDAKAARRSLATQLTVAMIVSVTLGLVGFALLGYFQANPSLLPAEMGLKDNADNIFPHFIAFHLPPGVSGLVIAALFAAAMSSIDSGVNSIAAVVQRDFIDRLGGEEQSERVKFRTARILALGVGTIVVLGSSRMGYVPGNITSMTNKTSGLLTTPIFCLFFFALFVPFAKPAGVWIGAICGTATAVLIAFSGPIFGVDPESGLDPVSFQWIGPAAILVNVVMGVIASLLCPPMREKEEATAT